MAGGKFLKGLGKVADWAGNFIPGIGIAGTIAEGAGKLMQEKQTKAEAKKTKAKLAETKAKVNVLLGSEPMGEKIKIGFSKAWDWMKENWWITIIIFVAIGYVIYLLFFKNKKRTGSRSMHSRRKPSYTPVRRKRTAQPKGSAWARKMLLARRRKANARKRK